MAHQVEELSTKPDELSSVPGIHMVEGGNHFYKLSSDLHMHSGTHTQTQDKCEQLI